jgi:CRISPR system Cascade subunit CasD
MTQYLVFQLYGPFAAWGDIAVGEVRPGVMRPSKSAVLGFVAASLGLRRDQEDEQRKLALGYGFAVRVDKPGMPMTDYHTIQVPSESEVRKRGMHTRKDELEGDRLETILSSRDYRMDAVSTVVLWAKEGAPYSLNHLAGRLAEPCFLPYLGRKSCPLALPVQAQVVPAGNIREALEKTSFASEEWIGELVRPDRKALYWDKDGDSGVTPQHEFAPRDSMISRKRWQFDTRHEYHSTLG